jgi:hypothetical protein
LTSLLLHGTEWLESAKYFENIHGWEVDSGIEAQLQAKYRVHKSTSPDDLKWDAGDT